MRLIREMDDVRIYELEGKEVKLTVNEYSVRVVDHNNCKVGRFEFDRREDYRSDFYIITYMYLDEQGDKYLRKGIGEQCVKFFKDYHDTLIATGSDNGHKNDDGSHLTGNGPSFADKMRRKKLIR
ncbi:MULTISPECIES: hypothetical protein [Vibrio]|uniref:hypothetical protein n=1 Tax=Vibrio TaxID=662 RepID=UPI0004710CD0|nr:MULTISPECIES: hypothetical protein [Vibrio]MBS9833571.1 hypothetical protein [Vibrio alginolyticus]MCR9710226.1 hypothetical protein [Vibrio parahaemolyticus]MDA0100877.1 hypothetical protein [Vibrio sp. ART SEL2]